MPAVVVVVGGEGVAMSRSEQEWCLKVAVGAGSQARSGYHHHHPHADDRLIDVILGREDRQGSSATGCCILERRGMMSSRSV